MTDDERTDATQQGEVTDETSPDAETERSDVEDAASDETRDGDAATRDDAGGSEIDPETALETLEAEIDGFGDELDAVRERIETLESTVETKTDRIEELESRVKRTQADFENYKKRAKKRQEQVQDRATEDLVTRLLDVRDNLKRALQQEDADSESLREGVKMTLSEFDRVLDAENVTEIDPEPGTETDPQRHEVLMNVESDQPEYTIVDVHRSGYEMADKVLRPAQVTVSDGSGTDE